MIRIYAPSNFIQERKYIIEVIFNEFLGLKYTLQFTDSSEYKIILKNSNLIIIEDHFFYKIKNKSYLLPKYLPSKVKFISNQFLVEKDIPVIFGTEKLEISSNLIVCGIDIFSSCFFMLTRWEEYVNKTRDNHSRFPGYASLAFKNNFLNRPVVNEYVEMLWNMLKFLECKQERKKKEFKFILTHDVDQAYKYPSLLDGNKEILGDILKRRNLSLAITNIRNKILTHLKIEKDPFDTYDYIMDISEKMDVKSYFFLHSSSNVRQDVNNDKFLKQIANKVKRRGHFLGYHPSYNAHNNYELFIKDKKKIENIIEQKLSFGRQHFLRFEIPTTWQIWNDADMEWDSSLSYADKEGFRCGTGDAFSTFNFLTRQTLNVKEIPLVIMDKTLISSKYRDLDFNKSLKVIKYYAEISKRYKMKFTILWHNSSLDNERRKVFYEKLISNIK